MGLGDDLMFLGEAEKVYNETGKKIFPVMPRGNGSVRPLPDHKWSPMYNNVDFITKDPTKDCYSLSIKPSNGRYNHYMEELADDVEGRGKYIKYKNYTPKPFKLRFTKEEHQLIKDQIVYNNLHRFVVINPDYKEDVFKSNKDWGWSKWTELSKRLSELKHTKVVRIKPSADSKDLPYAQNVYINNVRIAFGVISKAKLFVTYEGGLMHAMGGFNVPGVILYGGLTSVDAMKYERNTNIVYEHPETPCGRQFDCDHCKIANSWMTVKKVYDTIESKLND